MCRGYFKKFCGQNDKECVCCGHHARKRPCLNALCEKEFSSSCGAQLFCSLECQLQTEVGRLIFQEVDGERILTERQERRHQKVREAVSRYKKTDRGKKVNALCNRNRRARLKTKRQKVFAENGSLQ